MIDRYIFHSKLCRRGPRLPDSKSQPKVAIHCPAARRGLRASFGGHGAATRCAPRWRDLAAAPKRTSGATGRFRALRSVGMAHSKRHPNYPPTKYCRLTISFRAGEKSTTLRGDLSARRRHRAGGVRRGPSRGGRRGSPRPPRSRACARALSGSDGKIPEDINQQAGRRLKEMKYEPPARASSSRGPHRAARRPGHEGEPILVPSAEPRGRLGTGTPARAARRFTSPRGRCARPDIVLCQVFCGPGAAGRGRGRPRFRRVCLGGGALRYRSLVPDASAAWAGRRVPTRSRGRNDRRRDREPCRRRSGLFPFFLRVSATIRTGNCA